MKYISSDQCKAQKKSWQEAKTSFWYDGEEIFTSCSDEIKFIRWYINENIKIYDADNCGDLTVYFAFDTGKCFKVYYSWYIEREDGWELVDSYDVNEISWDECKNYVSSNRDWIVV